MKINPKKLHDCITSINFGLFAFLAFVLLLWNFSDSFIHYRGTDGWNQTHGLILSSEIIAEKVEDSEKTFYTPQFEYKYQYKGKTYTTQGFDRASKWSDRVNNSTTTASQNMIDKFPVGSEVTVYVNPWNCHDAVIYTDHGLNDRITLLVYGYVLLIPLTISLLLLGGGTISLFKQKHLLKNSKETIQNYPGQTGYFSLSQDLSRQVKSDKRTSIIILIVSLVIIVCLVKTPFSPCILLVLFVPSISLYGYLMATFGFPFNYLEGTLALKTFPVELPGTIHYKLEFTPTRYETGLRRPKEILIRLCQVNPDGHDDQEIVLYKESLDKYKSISPIVIHEHFVVPKDLVVEHSDLPWEFRVTFPNSKDLEDTVLHFPAEISYKESARDESRNDFFVEENPTLQKEKTFNSMQPTQDVQFQPRPVGDLAEAPLFRPYLEDDEVILWTGKAEKDSRDLQHQKKTIFWAAFIFSFFIWVILIIGFFITKENSPLLIIIPTLIFLYISYTLKTFFLDQKNRQEDIRYAITNHRALIMDHQKPDIKPAQKDLSVVNTVYFRCIKMNGKKYSWGDVSFSKEIMDWIHSYTVQEMELFHHYFCFQRLAEIEKVVNLIREVTGCKLQEVETENDEYYSQQKEST